jgi:hypothetical protein
VPGRARQTILTGEAAILLHLTTIDCKVSSISNRSVMVADKQRLMLTSVPALAVCRTRRKSLHSTELRHTEGNASA